MLLLLKHVTIWLLRLLLENVIGRLLGLCRVLFKLLLKHVATRLRRLLFKRIFSKLLRLPRALSKRIVAWLLKERRILSKNITDSLLGLSHILHKEMIVIWLIWLVLNLLLKRIRRALEDFRGGLGISIILIYWLVRGPNERCMSHELWCLFARYASCVFFGL